MKNRLMVSFVSRRSVAVYALLVLAGGVTLVIGGHPVIGSLVGYLGLLSLFLVCWHAFMSQAKAAERRRDVENCGKPECANCTKCTCRVLDASKSQPPQNGC